MSLADPDIAGTELARSADMALHRRARHTLDLVEGALRAGRVSLAFQPVFPARDHARPAWHEALVRISDDEGRQIPAGAFFPAIETAETGRLVDCRALDLALAELADDPGLILAVNLSPRSIGLPQWLHCLEAGLASHAGIANRLIVEITESSAILAPDMVRGFLQALRGHGIRVALDDFGAGFSALRHLRDLPIDILKIDGHFIRDVAKNPDNQVLVLALAGIGRHFGMTTVGEFVETAEDADWLTQAGIDFLQGYHLAAPAPRPLFPADRPD